MRKVILFFAAISLSSLGWSQTLNIHYKNGQAVEYNMDNIDYIEFTERSNNNAQVTSGDAVDLGLSVKWASCNVGATSPEENGDLFAWGETETKSKFSQENYLYYDSELESYMDIGTDIKGTDYDVAHVKWGGNWRMPTFDELQELKKKCEWKWSKFNGVNGYVVTGPNGNSIFFPPNKLQNFFWASTINKRNEGGKSMMAEGINIQYDSIGSTIGKVRNTGNYIRPVTNK